ncbi:hypothetical protein BC829DRAFT_385386 [Chytridium lagenaria]|nr:hypothetical protein BC829DRAFT_385386 [Chytridium lagenaria]
MAYFGLQNGAVSSMQSFIIILAVIIDLTSLKVSESECSMKCQKDSSEMCGAGFRMNLYGVVKLGAKDPAKGAPPAPVKAPPPPPPVKAAPPPPPADDDEYYGCYRDPGYGALRLLGSYLEASGTPESCGDAAEANKLAYFGLQNGGECWAAANLNNGQADIKSLKLPEGECNMKCPKDPNDMCGAPFKMNLYGVRKLGAKNPFTGSPAPVKAVPAPTPDEEYISIGCMREPFPNRDDDRILDNRLSNNEDIDSCADLAKSKGYKFFGLENGKYKEDNCGGFWRLRAFAMPSANLPVDYNKIGCLREPLPNQDGNRLLSERLGGDNEDIASCAKKAGEKEYAYFGLEYHGQCWAAKQFNGDVTKQFAFPDQCDTACSADGNQNCGGTWRLSAYFIPDLGGRSFSGKPALDRSARINSARPPYENSLP